MAATLYCLNRQDEAEKHWLRAVKLRPSYLEAAEHLVGLLYKKRSREAIEVINFIQQALRLKQHTSAQSRVTTTNYQAVGHSSHFRNSLHSVLISSRLSIIHE